MFQANKKHFHQILTEKRTSGLFYLSEFAQQLWDACQSFSGTFEVPVLEHQLNQLRVPGADSLLQDWKHPYLMAGGISLFLYYS